MPLPVQPEAVWVATTVKLNAPDCVGVPLIKPEVERERPDGKFDPTAYRGMLAQVGTSVPAFEAQERRSMQVRHLTQGLQISDFMTPAELKRIVALENEQRDVRYAIVPVARYAAAAKVDDAAVKAWYEAHAADYQTPESVRLQYAELRLDAITQEVAADAGGLQAFYEANKDR